MRPFVDFYRANAISPVAQDISDLERHFQRRASAYRALGIAPALARGSSVLEFGPGSGHNALYTCSLEPARYVAVDANPTGIASMRALFDAHPAVTQPHYVESYIEDFSTAERFDLVICEGVIPTQKHPATFARHVASFVRPGGVLLTTTLDGASALADWMRRLLNLRLPPDWSVERRVAAILPEIAPHLEALPGMSRPMVDYVHDSVVQPFFGPLFSLPDVVNALAPAFDVYGCTPRFDVDWRWYKTLTGDARRFNERFVDAYYRNVATFVDSRVEAPPHAPEEGLALLRRCDAYYAAMQAAQDGDPAAVEAAIAELRRVAGALRRLAPRAAACVHEFLAYLDGDRDALVDCFSFWGRGQQNVSFIRADEPVTAR